MSRKALVVGINYYEHAPRLYGCVEDARAVEKLLDQNGDEGQTKNFETTLLTGTKDSPVERAELREQIQELFAGESSIALLYLSGHGHVETTGGYLLASDVKSGDQGLPVSDIMRFANASAAQNRVIILDSCHSGAAAQSLDTKISELKDGTTILTASTEKQYTVETSSGGGLFTHLLIDALNGAAANVLGDITPGGVYAHIDQSLGAFGQRPVFKANVQRFVSLRRVKPAITLPELRRITEFFPTADYKFRLDPTYEPELKGRAKGAPKPNPANTEKFAILQKFNRLNLLIPVGASNPHMWHAAMESKACRLTALGEHYRRLVQNKLI